MFYFGVKPYSPVFRKYLVVKKKSYYVISWKFTYITELSFKPIFHRIIKRLPNDRILNRRLITQNNSINIWLGIGGREKVYRFKDLP